MSTPLSWKQIAGFALVGACIPAAAFLTILGFAFFTPGGVDVFLAMAPTLIPACLSLYAVAISAHSGYFVSRLASGLGESWDHWGLIGFFVCLAPTLLTSMAASNNLLAVCVVPYAATAISAIFLALRKRARGVPPNTA